MNTQDMIHLYKQGYGTVAIARLAGLQHHKDVWRRLKKAGVDLRPPPRTIARRDRSAPPRTWQAPTQQPNMPEDEIAALYKGARYEDVRVKH